MEESSGNNSKKKNVDIKPNIDMICKNIKKEPDFIMRKIKKEPDCAIREIKKEPDFVIREIKKEPDFMVREIKREPYQSDVKLVKPQLTELPPKSKRKKQKTKTNNTIRKATTKAKTKTSKTQSTQAEKTKSCKRNVISKKSETCTVKTKKKKKRKNKSKIRSKSAKSIKKEANTLLDQQGNGNLRLFGFKDELEYFSSESDHKEFEETSSEKNIIGKRTSLSSLSARDKVIHVLKSSLRHPSSNPKPLIQHAKVENTDLLGSILENQALWHSKTSHMKVNEDGSVEVTDRKNKKLVEIESPNGKKINLLRNKTNSTISTQARNGHVESLNISENLSTHSTKINIKIEACNTTETWGAEKVMNENKEQIWEEKIKVEGKKEKNSFPSLLETTSANLPKTEKSDDEVHDCQIISVYSEASKMFPLQRDKQRQMRFLSDESEIQIIEIKKIEKIEENKKPLKRHKNYQEEEKYRELDTAKRGQSPSPKRKKEESKQRKNVTCIIVE